MAERLWGFDSPSSHPDHCSWYWRAHLPAELPTSGDLELERIAREYPMTGGFVRNCAVRAAFLAAADGVALTRDHIERAIHLEYTQAGRISPSG